MDKIKVYDNFLNNEELNKVIELVTKKTWIFGQRSNQDRIYNQKNIPFWQMELEDEDYFKVDMVELIKSKCKKNLMLKKVYANGQTFGQDGSYHKDSEETNCLTFCLYLPDFDTKFDENVCGYLLIKIPDSIHNVYYETPFNRAIIFPSHYSHKGLAYNRFISSLRVSIVWKFEETKDT